MARGFRHRPQRYGSATVGLGSWPHAGMGQVFLIAVVSALDAGLITAAVVLLGRPRPARQLGAYLIGGMGFSIIFGLVIVLSLHGSKLRLGRSTQGIIEAAAGALLIVIAVADAHIAPVVWKAAVAVFMPAPVALKLAAAPSSVA